MALLRFAVPLAAVPAIPFLLRDRVGLLVLLRPRRRSGTGQRGEQRVMAADLDGAEPCAVLGGAEHAPIIESKATVRPASRFRPRPALIEPFTARSGTQHIHVRDGVTTGEHRADHRNRFGTPPGWPARPHRQGAADARRPVRRSTPVAPEFVPGVTALTAHADSSLAGERSGPEFTAGIVRTVRVG